MKLRRKSSGNETYELGVKVKKMWEEMRRDDCNPGRKKELCKELYSLIEGKAKSLIYAHDTVRVIETLLKVGDEHYRTRLFHELKDDLLNLSKNKYSRFFVLKLLRCGTKEQKSVIMQAMSGHVVEIMSHKIACDVLELAYNDYANAKQRSHMIQEFYGPRFRHFKEDISSLEAVLQKYPDLKKQILTDVYTSLQPIIDKGIFTNTLIHTLLKEYLYACDDAAKADIIENMKEGLLPILHTRDGARVAMMCVWHGPQKTRKLILKSFKGKYIQIAKEEHGHMVLLAIFDSIDDVILIEKIVFSELMAELNELVENENGRKILKYLVSPRNKIFFHPHVLSVLEEGDNNAYTKKPKEKKYKELQNLVAKPLLKLLHENIISWAKDPHWTLFVSATLQTFSDETIIPIYEALAEICSEPFLPNVEKHFLEESYMSKMVTFIIKCDKQRHEEKLPVFSTYLLAAAETEMAGWTLCNRGCFVLVALLETEIPEVVKEVMEICQPLKSKLDIRDFKGAAVLSNKIK